MAKLTPDQEKQRAERAARMQQPVEAVKSEDAEPDPQSLHFMIGVPETLQLGAKAYTLDEFPIMSIEEGYGKLYACPAILLAIALTSQDGNAIDLNSLTAAYNALVEPKDKDQKPQPYDVDGVRSILASLPEILAKAEIRERMVDAVVFALRPTNEGIKPEDLHVPAFTKRWFIEFLRAVYRVNIGMRENF